MKFSLFFLIMASPCSSQLFSVIQFLDGLDFCHLVTAAVAPALFPLTVSSLVCFHAPLFATVVPKNSLDPGKAFFLAPASTSPLASTPIASPNLGPVVSLTRPTVPTGNIDFPSMHLLSSKYFPKIRITKHEKVFKLP